MYGLRANGLGGYAVAGGQIAYVLNHHSYAADIYNGADLYYIPRRDLLIDDHVIPQG